MYIVIFRFVKLSCNTTYNKAYISNKLVFFKGSDDFIHQLKTEIDTVLKNLHIMNNVFTRASNMNYNCIFHSLGKANKGLLDKSETMPIHLKEEGKYFFFPTFTNQKAPSNLYFFCKY